MVIQNLSDFSASVLLRSAVACSIRWQKSCRFAVAVVVGMILIINAYLPQPSLGIELYAEALCSVRGFAEAAPKVHHTFIACDANSHLRYHEDLSHIVGPLTMFGTRHQAHPGDPDYSDSGPSNKNPAPVRPVSTARRHGSFPREQLLTEFALDLQVRAANTFPAQHQLPLQPQAFLENDAIWTHCWYRNGRTCTQIDFVFSNLNTTSSAYIYYDIDCDSDHKLLISRSRVLSDDLQPGNGAASGGLFRTPGGPRLCTPSVGNANPHRARTQKRVKSTKDWRPRSEADSRSFASWFGELPRDATVSDLQACLATSAHRTPFTNVFDRPPKQRFTEPDGVVDPHPAFRNQRSSRQASPCEDLCRRRRRWLAEVSRVRFAQSALKMQRTDKSSKHRISSMYKERG